MNMNNLTEHKCAGKCPEFKGEQCKHCLISCPETSDTSNYSEIPNSSDFMAGDVVVLTGACHNFHSDDLFEIQRKFTNTLRVIKSKNHKLLVSDNEIRHATPVELQQNRRVNKIILDDDMGDDSYLENHISPLCLSDSRKNESQSPLSIKQDTLSRMESCYIEQKKHVELLQTEVTRLNSTVERLKAENVAMQVELDKSRNQAYKHLESCENSLNSQTERFDELSEKVFKVFEIINNPDNHYCPFGWVAEQIQAVMGEVQGEVA